MYTTIFILKLDQKQHEQVTSMCEHKVVRKFALESQKSMHCLYPTNTPNKKRNRRCYAGFGHAQGMSRP